MALFGKKKKRRNRKRHKEPFGARARRAVLRTLKVVLVLAALPALGYGGLRFYRVLVTTEYLAVRTINVTGAERVAPEDAIELAGITEGINILSFKASEAVEGLKANPWVKAAEIRRRLPDTVEIHLAERRPMALVSLDGLYVMDSSGVVFKKFAVEDRLDLPVVTGLTREGLEAGGAQKGLLELVSILSGREGFSMESVSEINVDQTFGLSIYTLNDGVRLAVGTDGFEAKLASFEKVVASRGGALRGVEAMDLNNSRSVVVRFGTGAFKEGGDAHGQKG
ncbi:MAG: cell division protein FtsQ/DivIB [Thermodesulfobacteriota bacterium]